MAGDGVRIGSVSVSVVPDARTFSTDLQAQILPAADRLGREISQRISAPISDAIVRSVADGTTKSRAVSAQGGSASGGAFADTFRAKVDAALRNLPTPKVGVDATEADAELADIRERLRALSDVRVGVDIAAADALAELDRLKERLDELGAHSPDIGVRVDAAKASADLAAVRGEVNALDGKTAHINVEADTATAGQGISTMLTSVLALGPALVPLGAAATVGIGGIATAAASGAAGLGVLTLGFSAVSNAVQLVSKEHTQAAADAARNAAAQTASASAQVAAASQVKSATEALALARTNAAQQEIAAAEAVARAQYAKTQADQQEASAQTQLNDAREQAARDLESASNRVVDTQLAAKQAAIDVTNAETTYTATLKNATSTQLQRRQAALDLAKAQQALVEANQAAKQAEQDNTSAQKDGVNGAPAVVSAVQAVVTARHNQQQASQSLTDAERAQAVQRQQAAFAIDAAQRSLASAYAAQAKAAQGSGAAGTAAMSLIRDQLAKTNPAVLAFARFFEDTLVPAFNQLKTAAAVGFLPGLQAGLKALAPLAAPFTAFVSGLAQTMGGLFLEASKALTAPFWTQFFGYVAQTAGPTLVTMSRTIGALATGFAGLMQAFAPVVTQMGAGIARLAAGFATFGKNAGSDSSIQGFLRYVERVGPQVVTTVGHIVTAVGHIVRALAPIGPVVLSGLKVFADLITAIPVPVLTAIAIAVIGVVAALKAWAIVQAILNGLMLIWDTLTSPWLILMAGAAVTILAIVAAVAALAFGIYELVKHWSAVWNAIKTATEVVYNWIRAHWPLLAGILAGPVGIAAALIATHWEAVKVGATRVVDWISGKFSWLVGFFQKMPGWISHAVAGMWDGITVAFRAAIDTIIGWWDGFVSYLKVPSFRIDSHIPGLPTFKFGGVDIGSHLQIPYLAQGGVAQAATLGVFGEAGREAILPLTDPNAMRQIAEAIGAHGGKRPLIGELNIHNPAPEPTSRSLPKALRRVDFELSMA